MTFRSTVKAYDQIDPTFLPGYKYESRYHNIGQLKTPYEGKFMGQNGDYAPIQATDYYTPQNRNYPYPLFSDMNRCQYVVDNFSNTTSCTRSTYPNKYIPENYFAARMKWPSGHIKNVEHRELCYGHQGTNTDPDSSIENYKRLAVSHVPLTNTLFR